MQCIKMLKYNIRILYFVNYSQLFGVIGIFHRHNTSVRTVALELTQPLTEMSTMNIFCG
jgi:hypothetical protein